MSYSTKQSFVELCSTNAIFFPLTKFYEANSCQTKTKMQSQKHTRPTYNQISKNHNLCLIVLYKSNLFSLEPNTVRATVFILKLKMTNSKNAPFTKIITFRKTKTWAKLCSTHARVLRGYAAHMRRKHIETPCGAFAT